METNSNNKNIDIKDFVEVGIVNRIQIPTHYSPEHKKKLVEIAAKYNLRQNQCLEAMINVFEKVQNGELIIKANN